MSTYDAGTTIRFEDEIRDKDNELFDPTSVTITIYKGSTKEVDAQAMTKDVVGKYYYNWQTLTTTATGSYSVFTTAVSGGYTARKKQLGDFYLN